MRKDAASYRMLLRLFYRAEQFFATESNLPLSAIYDGESLRQRFLENERNPIRRVTKINARVLASFTFVHLRVNLLSLQMFHSLTID